MPDHYVCDTSASWARFLFNHPPLHENAMTTALDLIRRQAFDAGANAMRLAAKTRLSGLNRAAIATIAIDNLKGRP